MIVDGFLFGLGLAGAGLAMVALIVAFAFLAGVVVAAIERWL